MPSLPIAEFRDLIVRTLRDHQVVVIAGETGCGKTTQVPQFLLEAGYADPALGVIGVTEPRRVAAMSVATWVAECRDVQVGTEVGYKIRHEKYVDPGVTKIEYMTEGILLREMLADPLLSRYSVIVVDEVHERGINQDTILAHLRRIIPLRPTLKVIVMSATIAEEKFSEYFGWVPIIKVPGRTFPVEIRYLSETPSDPVDEALRQLPRLVRETEGDLLVFVPDYASIRLLVHGLPLRLDPDIRILCLYGDQDPAEQRQVVFERDPNRRHVIIATNVAETSVTLDGIRTVVDTGLIKLKNYEPGTAISTLKPHPHSRAGLDQRAGRAGRTAPGLCLRMMSEKDYDKRRRFTKPEIQRMGLDDVMLHMLALGYDFDHITEFGWMSPPRMDLWIDARRHLELLGAVNRKCELTQNGHFMADIPLPPAMSKMIIEARKGDCVKPVLIIAASFSTRPIFVRPPGDEEDADDAHYRFMDPTSDFLTVLKVFKEWQKVDPKNREQFCINNYLNHRALAEIDAVTIQLMRLLDEKCIPISTKESRERIGRAVTAGLVLNLLTLKSEGGKSYRAKRQGHVRIAPDSAIVACCNFPTYAVCAEILETRGTYARRVQAVPKQWLIDLGVLSGRKEKNKKNRRKKNFRNDTGRKRGGNRNHCCCR